MATFLTDLADSDPAAVLRSSGVAVLLSHLDGENYAMRNAIISMLTAIVCHIVATDGQVCSYTRVAFRRDLDALHHHGFHEHDCHVDTRNIRMTLEFV